MARRKGPSPAGFRYRAGLHIGSRFCGVWESRMLLVCVLIPITGVLAGITAVLPAAVGVPLSSVLTAVASAVAGALIFLARRSHLKWRAWGQPDHALYYATAWIGTSLGAALMFYSQATLFVIANTGEGLPEPLATFYAMSDGAAVVLLVAISSASLAAALLCAWEVSGLDRPAPLYKNSARLQPDTDPLPSRRAQLTAAGLLTVVAAPALVALLMPTPPITRILTGAISLAWACGLLYRVSHHHRGEGALALMVGHVFLYSALPLGMFVLLGTDAVPRGGSVQDRLDLLERNAAVLSSLLLLGTLVVAAFIAGCIEVFLKRRARNRLQQRSVAIAAAGSGLLASALIALLVPAPDVRILLEGSVGAVLGCAAVAFVREEDGVVHNHELGASNNPAMALAVLFRRQHLCLAGKRTIKVRELPGRPG